MNEARSKWSVERMLISMLGMLLFLLGKTSGFTHPTRPRVKLLTPPSSSPNQNYPISRVKLSSQSSGSQTLNIEEDESLSLTEDGRIFQDLFSFPLDDWQLQAGGALQNDHNVVVCSPTGSGKTVVAEMALYRSQELRQKGIYTTPLKALSNEKFRDLSKTFGNVGLSTGDVSINKGAPITVMTTEVYRNMAWRDSLADTAVVILDEFHYMGLPGRGGVWEECVITSPSSTQIVALSATLSNARALTQWIESVTGRTTVLVQVPDAARPVPLNYLFATRDGLHSLFRDPLAGPGAPKGLLGYRRNGGEPDEDAGFGKKKQNKAVSKLPRGLQVNPVLLEAAKKRQKKVDRAMERQRMRKNVGSWSDDNPRDQIYRKPRKLSPREERKERERLLKKELRRSVPSLPALVNRLEQKGLLPAIFFIFSRAGCNDAAQTVARYLAGPKHGIGDEEDEFNMSVRPKRVTRQRGKNRIVNDEDGRSFRSGSNYLSEELIHSALYGDDDELDDSVEPQLDLAGDENGVSDTVSLTSPSNFMFYATSGLLTFDQVQEVAKRVDDFNRLNEEIALEEHTIEELLLGIGTHHAALLPAHKSFVEVLFQRQLLKVIFATETLAAGINMPARTTVVCSMAKRGGGSSMNLLETSNLLQMAGRAGRRGKDTDGTCVIVATPFETQDDAAKILTDPIKPISSQFRPSYSLCVNLIARGDGKLDVAKQLVGKSFAMWEKGVSINGGNSLSPKAAFTCAFFDTLDRLVANRTGLFDVERIRNILENFSTKKGAQESMKKFGGLNEKLRMEQTTLGFLQQELQTMKKTAVEDSDEEAIFSGDVQEMEKTVLQQENRVGFAEKKFKKSDMSVLATVANSVLAENTFLSGLVLSAKRTGGYSDSFPPTITAVELFDYFRSTELPTAVSILPTDVAIEDPLSADGDSWVDFLSITKTLIAYGCLEPVEGTFDDESSIEDTMFQLTVAGRNIGALGLENSLWALVALGAASDVTGASSRLDRRIPEEIVDDETLFPAQDEAKDIVEVLLLMSPSEMAGYVSCLISDGDSSLSGFALVEQLQSVTMLQRRAIEKTMFALERLSEVQRQYSGDKTPCSLDLSGCKVVTSWAEGCSWAEALELSGSAPGDLSRSLSRVLDALRQIGNLEYSPRRVDLDKPVSQGIDPGIRRLCRDASYLINRYPVKDTFLFESDDADEEDTEVEELPEPDAYPSPAS